MELFCEKGIGKTHAKWSPVSTAYYRLVPSITIKEDILNEDAVELKNLCPTGVYDIEDLGKHKSNSQHYNILYRASLCGQCKELHYLQGVHQA